MELRELAALLKSDQLPVQQEIARVTGVAQPIVSRARSGRLTRITNKTTSLLAYARSKVRAEEVAAAAAMAVDEEVLGHGQLRERGGTDHARDDGLDRSGAPYADAALNGVKEYLKEGYDARLVVEQLVVLRRAQQVRRAGRQRAAADDPS